MPPGERQLRLVPACPPGDARGDLALTAVIFAIALLPLASALAGVGEWGGGSLGLGTLGVLFAGRELCVRLASLRRARPPSGRGAGPRGARGPAGPARRGRGLLRATPGARPGA